MEGWMSIMRSRSDDIRKRIAKRRKEMERKVNGPSWNLNSSWNNTDDDSQKTNQIQKSNDSPKPSQIQQPNDSLKPSQIQQPNDSLKPNSHPKPNDSPVPSSNQKLNHAPASDRNEKTKPGSKAATIIPFPDEDDHQGFNQYISYEGGGPEEEKHPLFRKEVFFFKVMASACLFLGIAIMFRSHSPALDSAKNIVKQEMNTEFQFAAVTNWYEKEFGKPLALLPLADSKTTQTANQQYAVPASGRILENFQKNGQGIMIETSKGTRVEAMNGGLVTFSGVKAGIGKTVIIQHADQTESWYGNLDAINVSLYQHVNKGDVVGTVSGSAGKDQSKGEFYFAIKKGDHFIDPIQVINFE